MGREQRERAGQHCREMGQDTSVKLFHRPCCHLSCLLNQSGQLLAQIAKDSVLVGVQDLIQPCATCPDQHHRAASTSLAMQISSPVVF